LKQLRAAVQNPAENRDQLRARVLAFRAKNLTTPAGIAAAGLLRKLPSPLDRLAPMKDAATDSAVVRLMKAGDSTTRPTRLLAKPRSIFCRKLSPMRKVISRSTGLNCHGMPGSIFASNRTVMVWSKVTQGALTRWFFGGRMEPDWNQPAGIPLARSPPGLPPP